MRKLSPGIHFPTIKGVKRKVKVLASGKWKFMKMPKGKKRKSRKTRSSNPKRRVRKIGRRRKRRGGGKSITRTAFKYIRLGALLAPAGYIATKPWSTHGKVRWGLRWYTGFDIDTGKFEPHNLAKGWGPYLMACLATYGIPKLTGILRRL